MPKRLLLLLTSILLITLSGCITQSQRWPTEKMRTRMDSEFTASTQRISREKSKAISNARTENLPLAITHCAAMTPNSAGGVNVVISILNTSIKTIKYVYLEVTPYNRVKDKVRSEITGKEKARLQIIGPIEPNHARPADVATSVLYGKNGKPPSFFDNVWWNHSIHSIQVSLAEIIFMDGSKETLSGQNLNKIFAHSFDSCWVE